MAAEAFVEFAERSYGNLRAPDFSALQNAIERRPYAALVERLAQFSLVQDGEHNSWHDDVALCVLLSSGEWGATLWLSYVAPYAAMIAGPNDSRPRLLRDEDFVYSGSVASGWLAQIRSVLESAGLWVLPPWLLRQEMEFYSVEDGQVQKMPMLRVFFTDLEDHFSFEG
ncbi:hypothetical protein [Micromonospora andamanensis]|uniref:hypothetical protein n=1 Tax=Micromonospora andamanensis TaxID=1287068 RepID=UPI0019508082|nr:hypothetical protein [Micromonospora andamanensis]GIJ42823.1 hypothetical protein Vwe01_61480 [Micromonospora andamanensis]